MTRRGAVVAIHLWAEAPAISASSCSALVALMYALHCYALSCIFAEALIKVTPLMFAVRHIASCFILAEAL